MSGKTRIIAAAALVCMTTGCTMYSLEKLRHTTPSGTPFQTELSRLYMDFAAQGEKEYDWFNSWHFADKGLMLAYGKDMPPETLNEWDIPQDVLPEMEKARAELVSALTQQTEERHPGEAANAQFYFDCWVKYQEANWQEDEIAYCRDNFRQALGEIKAPVPVSAIVEPMPEHEHKKSVRKTEVHKKASAFKHAVSHETVSSPMEAEHEATQAQPQVQESRESKKELKAELRQEKQMESKAQPPAAAAETVSYIVFFEKGQPVPSDAGSKVINDIGSALQGGSGYEVVISDHGSGKADPVLAAERRDVVRKRLINDGVKPSAIKSAADASDKTAKRRIEIFINE